MTVAQAALLISIGSLFVSFLGFYFTHFRPGTVKGSLGLLAHLYHPRDGGTAIYIPVSFINETRARGMLRRACLELISQNGSSHFITWQRRSTIGADLTYTDIADASPFFVEPQAVVTHLFWFWWPDDAIHPLDFTAGSWVFRLHFWINREKKPRVSASQTLKLDTTTAQELLRRRREKDPQTRIQPFEHQRTVGAFFESKRKNWWKDIKPLY